MSSVVAAVFNRNVLKFAAALAIPLFIAWFFMYSSNQATVEVSKYREEQKNAPTADNVEITDYNIKEVNDSNQIRWQLVARKGMLSSDKNVELTDVLVEYFDGNILKARLTAPFGQANEQTRHVKLLSTDAKPVMAEGEAGKSKFRANQVELTKNNQFTATGGVIIEWPGVAKVRGNTATGALDLANGPKNLKVVGNTRAEIMVK